VVGAHLVGALEIDPHINTDLMTTHGSINAKVVREPLRILLNGAVRGN